MKYTLKNVGTRGMRDRKKDDHNKNLISLPMAKTTLEPLFYAEKKNRLLQKFLLLAIERN